MSYQMYSLTRVIDGEHTEFATSFTTSDDDAINCAHMLAAGFNTMSRNFLGDWVLGVVDTTSGTVQYDGKIEKIERPDPHTVPTSFKFEASTDADTMVTIFDNENGRLMFPGKLKFTETDETTSASAAEAVAPKINRKVLEAAYVELQAVKEVLFDAGVETIPADAGVRDLLAVKRAMSEQIAKITHEREQANAAARAELIEHVKRAYAKWGEVDPGRQRESLKAHLRGMLEVLSKYLVAIGEADADERHAVALRVCEIPEGNYLYDDA